MSKNAVRRSNEGEVKVEKGATDIFVILNVILDLLHLLLFAIYTTVSIPVKYFISLNNPKSIEGQTILVTGASGGIGAEICRQLAQIDKSITLICWDVNAAGVDKLVKELKKMGLSRVYGYAVDVTDREKVMETAQTIKTEVGNVTMLFNNAGISGDGLPLWEQNPATVEKTIQVNLVSNFWTLQAFLPAMIARGQGHIITTCSVLGTTQIKHLSPYNASKFGVFSTIETLKLDLASDPRQPDIKFTTVYPNLIETPMVGAFNKTYKYDFMKNGVPPSVAAEKIISGMRRDKEHVYTLGHNVLLPLFMAVTPGPVFRKIHQIFKYDAVRTEKTQ